MTTFLTTTSLAAGTWRITFGSTVSLSSTGFCVVQIAAGSATATFGGQRSGEIAENQIGSVAFTSQVTITAPGTLVFQAQGNLGTIDAATPDFTVAACTGWSADRVA